MSKIVRITNGNYELYVKPNGTISFTATNINLNGSVNITGNVDIGDSLSVTNTIDAKDINITNNLAVTNDTTLNTLKVTSDTIQFNSDAILSYENASFKFKHPDTSLADITANSITSTSLKGSPVVVDNALKLLPSTDPVSAGFILYSKNNQLWFKNDVGDNDQFVSKSKAIIYSMIF
jgi:hypothetical protein